MPKIIAQFALGLWGISPGNYSSIAPIEDHLYAVVDDKDRIDGFKLLTLELDTVSGKLLFAEMIEPEGMRQRRVDGLGKVRDCEGACYFPSAHTLFVSGEADQEILEYDLNANPTGRGLKVPECMGRKKIASNYGFEALTYNQKLHRFWTTTESMLPADGSPLHTTHSNSYNPLKPVSSASLEAAPIAPTAVTTTEGTPDNEQLKDSLFSFQSHLRLLSFDDHLRPVASYIYTMDEPLAKGRKGNGVHGVPSMFALDNGKIIILEREGFCPKWKVGAFVNVKLYVVDLNQEKPVPLDTPMSKITPEQVVKKQLLTEFKTSLTLFRRTLANYEGICLGPRLADGRQTLLLIADSQNGMGNFLFHLKDYVGVIALPQDTQLFD